MNDTPNSRNTDTAAIPVVAIGASAGGLEQIKLLLGHMPADTGAAFVVIQHLDPDHESHLTELLAQAGDLPAVTIEDRIALQANRVHVLPPGRRLSMGDDGMLHLTARQAREARPTLIDGFFRELAAARGRRAIGIVLSGNGSDGALGLKAIRSEDGLAMAQQPDSAEFDGMPRAAARYASPDCLLETADMVVPLCNHLRISLAGGERTARGESDDDAIDNRTLARVLEILGEYDMYDFRHHKPSMLKRRLRRRMALDDVSSVETYLCMLRKHADERARLCSDFLISVTDFFRDPDSYMTLEQSVIRKLLRNRSADSPIRVWVTGCATGEEAYSIAILLAEAIEGSGQNHKFVVFATDIDEKALARARTGLYPESIETDLSAERLHRFFDKIDDHYQVKRRLREHVVFAPQSVTDDPPYSRLDLISCRNLLIYMTAATQKRLITLFHFALTDPGYLFLGGSETVGKQIDLFEPVSKEHRIYHRLATDRQYRVDFRTPSGVRNAPTPEHGSTGRNRSYQPKDAEQVARDILLAEYVPASVLINRKLEILCSYGPTRDYLSLPLGQPSLALLDMARDKYRSHLRAVTHRAFRNDEKSDISTTVEDTDERTLVITARPLRQPKQARGLVLITFERLPEAASERPVKFSSSDLEQQLSEELDATRNELHGTIAALEESNEDLKGTNEEIMSMNEELQSTNEELKISKEELQSDNEELTTVNSELEVKVAELESAHDDLSNLFTSTHLAMLFLDRSMCIKRFTPAIRDLLNLITSDIGRPLRDMTLKFNDPDLLTDADKVLDDLASRETEVLAANGRWYKRSILPYRTRDDVINGVVVTFADITDLKQTMLTAREHEARLDLAVSALIGGMWEIPLDPETPDELPDSIYLSERLKSLLGFDAEQLPDTLQAWIERIVPQDRKRFKDIAGRQSDRAQPLHYRIRHRDGGTRWFASFGRLITDAQGRPMRWIGIDCDITDAKQAEIRQRTAQAQLRLLADALPELIAFVDADNTIRFTNAAFNDWFDGGSGDPAGRTPGDVLGKTVAETLAPGARTALDGKAVCSDVALARGESGHRFHAHHIPHRVDGKVAGYYLLMISTETRTNTLVNEEQERARLVYFQRMATIGEMASTLAHDLNQPLSAINSYAGGLTRMLHAGKPAEKTVPVVQKMADQVTRAGAIIGTVRDFVGRRQVGQEPLDLNRLLGDAVTLTAGRARKMSVDTRLSEHTPLPTVHGDPVQIQQVLVNLISNALDAMRDTDSDHRTLWLTTEISDTTHVQAVVADSGPGIAPGKLESIFDSFQSTKLEGMGMGLAISRSIVEWHGGQLWAESQDGHGATFYLRLPTDASES